MPLMIVSKHYALKQVLISIVLLIGLAMMMTLTFVSFYHSPKLLNIYSYYFVWETFNLHLCSSFQCCYQPCRIVLFRVHLIIVVETLIANISLTSSATSTNLPIKWIDIIDLVTFVHLTFPLAILHTFGIRFC